MTYDEKDVIQVKTENGVLHNVISLSENIDVPVQGKPSVPSKMGINIAPQK